MTPSRLHAFLVESNHIEGEGPPTESQVASASTFIRLMYPSIDDLIDLVKSIAPHARLRDVRGLNVRVGSHAAPYGGPKIREKLIFLLTDLDTLDPYEFHVAYETLHPFTDGNGRSGRLLWLWQMERRSPGGLQRLGFLHAHYYQSFDAARKCAKRLT